MTRILRNLKIDDVSSVDVGAGRGVRVVLHKRDGSQLAMSKHRDGVPADLYRKPIIFGADIPAGALAYLKREFTQAERDALAQSGHALPDGSYPIDNKSDLHNAIQAIGRAKNPARAKAHIKARARALGAEDHLPSDWVGKAGNDDEPRDDHGRWTSGGGGGGSRAAEARNIGRGLGRMVDRQIRNERKFPVGSTAHDQSGQKVTVTGHQGLMIHTSAGSYHDSKLTKAWSDAAREAAAAARRQSATVGPLDDPHGMPAEQQEAWQEEQDKKRRTKKNAVAGVIGLVNKAIIEGVRKKAVDFGEAIDAADNVEDAGDLMCGVRDAVCALDCSINSILCDDSVADKPAAIAESYGQFKAYIGNLSLEDDDGDADDKTEKNMPVMDLNPQIKKALEEAIAKVAGEKDAEIAKLAQQVAYLKMRKEHQAYHDGLGSDEAKRKFTSMTDDERDDEMTKTKKRAEDDPIYKAMRAQNEDLQKRLTAIEDERALEVAKRDARELGLTQNDAGEVVMKMRRGDAAAIKTYEGYMVGLAKAQRNQVDTGKLFGEFGTGRGNDGTAGDGATSLLMAKAAELRVKEPTLTEAQAFEKVYLDPANKALREQEANERFAKIGARVA